MAEIRTPSSKDSQIIINNPNRTKAQGAKLNAAKVASRAVISDLLIREKDLSKKLLAFYDRMAEIAVPIDYFRFNEQMNNELNSVVRRAVQDGYLLGHQAIEASLKKRVPNYQLFITETDIAQIKSITKFGMDQLWLIFGKLLSRNAAGETVQKGDKVTQKPAFKAEAQISALAELILFSGYNNSIGAKINNINGQRIRARQSGKASGLGDIFRAIGSTIQDAFSDLFGINDVQELQAQEIFLTKEDDKVDPEICEPLARQVFDVNDTDKPIPPLHRFCRCVLVPVFSG